MQFSFSVKNLSLGLAIVAMSAAAASAQSLSGVNTKLLTPLDSQTAKVGQQVAVKLSDSVKITSGETLPKGTQLVGSVSEVKAAEGSTPTSVTVVFNTAELKSGKKIPVKATLLAAYPANGDDIGPAPSQVEAKYTVDQQPGAIRGVTMKSAVENPDSGTFSKEKGNFKLAAGSFLQLAVGPASANSSTSAAE
ncbi:MAG TPA: hypothetical protein VGS02_08710 [Acidobacteriaceae bacterium]|nr:hypothetical protein [Acidobacteriaceae bacterium]